MSGKMTSEQLEQRRETTEQKRQVALQHGGYSAGRIRAKARAHQRRIRSGLGVSARDLDPITKELLRLYAEGAARADLLPADSKESWTAFNSTSRALRRLEERLRELGLIGGKAAPGATFERYLAERRNGESS